jgi:transmembrane sensor
MQSADAKKLFEKYQSGTCSPEEKAIVENWLTFGNATDLDLSEEELDQDLSELKYKVSKIPVKKTVLWPKIAMTAAAVAAVVFGVWFYTSRHPDTSSSRTAGRDLLNDIAPGKNGATITLGNGKVIQLSDSKTGVVVGEDLKYSDGTDVRYSSGSQFSGSLKGSQKTTGPVGVHTLSPTELQGADGKVQNLMASTSRGQTYQFTLPDGTKVWLNADSKISFPSQFNGEERKIALSGEGYFEVSKDKAHRFIVKTTTQEVTVLGTHFNISSYSDDHVTTTTLLEGSVKLSAFDVISGKSNAILKPNQQAIQNPQGGMQVRDVDVAEAVDWKNGEFVFANEPLTSILKRVARWYDVDIVYERETPTATFTGSVSRFDNASAVLTMLEKTGDIQFEIKGKKIIVK